MLVLVALLMTIIKYKSIYNRYWYTLYIAKQVFTFFIAKKNNAEQTKHSILHFHW
jgi:hypothetical protein